MAEFASLVAQVDSTSAVAAKAALLDYAQAAGVAETATLALQRASGKAAPTGAISTATRELERYDAAQQRSAATTAAAASAVRRLEQEQARAARTVEMYARRADAIEKALNPASAASIVLAQRTRDLEKAHAAGAISLDRHNKLLAQATNVAKAAEAQFSRTAASTKLTANELTNLGYQAQDVFVSLASGQNPFMVLAQQGSQISQILGSAKGGAGGALKELGSIAVNVLGKAGPIAVGVTALGAFAIGAIAGEREANRLANTLKATGINASLTGAQFGAMARTISDEANSSIGAARQTLEELAKTGEFNAETMGHLGAAATQLGRLTGQSSQEVARSFSGMGRDVSAFASEFNAQYRVITAAQWEHIRLLQEQGRTTEAQLAFARAAHEGLASAGEANLGVLERGWRAVGNAISDAIDNLKSFGRQQSAAEKLATVNAQLSGGYAQYDPLTRNTLLQRQAELTAQVNASKAREESARVQTAGQAAASRLATQWGDMADNTARARREIQAYKSDIEKLRRANPNSTFLPSAAQQRQTEEAILKRYTPSARGASPKPRFDQSEQAIEQATRAELQARMALTGNIEEIARLKLQEINAELGIQKQRTARSVHEGSITKVAAETVNLLNEQAAAAKRTGVDREKTAALAQQELSLRSAINADLDRLAQAQTAMARDAVEANGIAAQSLARRQKLERDSLNEELRAAVEREAITGWKALERSLAQRSAQQAERVLAAEEARRRLVTEAANLQRSELELRGAALEAQGMLSRSDYSRAVNSRELLEIEHEIARLEAERAVELSVRGSKEEQIAKNRLEALLKIQEAERELADRETLLINAIDEASDAVSGFANAFGRGDWARALYELERTIELIKTSFEKNGALGGAMTLGSAAATAVGGKTGRAIGGGLGIAGLGLSAANSLGAWGAAATAKAALLGTSSALGGLATTVAGVLGPIGLAAGALYAAAKIFNVGGKPTNAGAGFDLRTGALSGNKRTEETEGAARSAGEAIQGIQDALKAAGIGITDAVTGLVLGTRDQTQIYLQSGQTLRSAVGDSGAAVDTAMRALLSSATFVSEAQKALVDSALAAGKGFDAIAEILAKYEAAQGIAKSLDAEILRLRDPQAFDTKAVRDDIEAQRKAYQQLASEGFLTAAQLAEITTQLSTLEGLRLDEVTKRYADAQTEAAMTLEEKTRTLRGLDIEYQRILGNEAAAVAMERADVIAGLKGDADLIAAYTRNWAAQGLTETFEAAINITRKRLVTPTVRDPLSGVDVTSMWRGADLAFQAANDNVTSMAERAMDAARAFGELQTSLKGYRDELLYGDKSALSADARYADLEKLFRSTANSAALGDQGAAGQLQSVIDQFLDASRSQFGSGAGYASDFARAIAALDAATGKVNAPTATLRALQGYDIFDPEGPTVASLQDSRGFVAPYWAPNGSDGPGEPQNYTLRFPSGRPTPASNTMSKEDAEELKALLRRQNQLLEAANNQRGQAAVLTKEGLEGVKGEVRRGNKDRVRLAG